MKLQVQTHLSSYFTKQQLYETLKTTQCLEDIYNISTLPHSKSANSFFGPTLFKKFLNAPVQDQKNVNERSVKAHSYPFGISLKDNSFFISMYHKALSAEFILNLLYGNVPPDFRKKLKFLVLKSLQNTSTIQKQSSF